MSDRKLVAWGVMIVAHYISATGLKTRCGLCIPERPVLGDRAEALRVCAMCKWTTRGENDGTS